MCSAALRCCVNCGGGFWGLLWGPCDDSVIVLVYLGVWGSACFAIILTCGAWGHLIGCYAIVLIVFLL